MHSYAFEQLLVYHTFLPMSKLKLLLTGLTFAYKRLLVFFMHTAHCHSNTKTVSKLCTNSLYLLNLHL